MGSDNYGGFADMRNAALSVRSVSKSFGSTQALDRVSLDIMPGEVHAVIGQNGSGKSTLIKILSGYYTRDIGEVLVRGDPLPKRVDLGTLKSMQMAFVHQDLGLVPTMTVLENLRVGRYHCGPSGRIKWADERSLTKEQLSRFGIFADPDSLVETLSPSEQAVVAIARAVQVLERSDDARPGVLVLDEPTAALPAHEVELVLAVVRRLGEEGHAVLLVTHHLKEVFAVASRATVLRNGRLVDTVEVASVNEDSLIEMMLGRRLAALAQQEPMPPGDLILEANSLYGRVITDLSLRLHRGEVVGLTGLLGAGFEEVPYLLFGSEKLRGGHVKVGGSWLHALSPSVAKSAGLALVPADRLRAGGVPRATVKENVTLPFIDRYRRLWGINRSAEFTDVERLLVRFQVVPARPSVPLSALSGGNQQKALIGRWLDSQPSVLLLHEPTQGVDVESRQAIIDSIKDAAGRGMAVIVASSQYEDIVALCSRALVFHKGALVHTTSCSGMSPDDLARHCFEASVA